MAARRVDILEKIREKFEEKCAYELEKVLGESVEIEAKEDIVEVLHFFGRIFLGKLKTAIFVLLVRYESPVCAISAVLDKDQTLISHYLAELKQMDIITKRSVGKFRFYKVDVERIREKFKVLKELLEA